MENAVVIKSLTKKYKKTTACDGLELQIKKGEIFSLLGVNGAGKTTAIKMLSCLTAPTSGDAFLLGRSIISEPEKVKEIIGVSPQETAVAPNLTVKENLELMAGISCASRQWARQKALETAERFSLNGVYKKQAKTLSGGWQRRLSIAMALITSPEILFLDEPTLGLDVIARRELHEIIKQLRGEVTVILTTHYLEEAESLSDRVAIMSEGKLRAVGTADEIKVAAGTSDFETAFISLATVK